MTEQTKIRPVYDSIEQTYSLDPARVFEIVANLDQYVEIEKHKAEKAWPTNFTSFHLLGIGRTLSLSAEALSRSREILTTVNLADLVLSEDGKRLDFKVHAFERLVVDPSDLSYIGNRYKTQ